MWMYGRWRMIKEIPYINCLHLYKKVSKIICNRNNAEDRKDEIIKGQNQKRWKD